jgi:hypothetical protein
MMSACAVIFGAQLNYTKRREPAERGGTSGRARRIQIGFNIGTAGDDQLPDGSFIKFNINATVRFE